MNHVLLFMLLFLPSKYFVITQNTLYDSDSDFYGITTTTTTTTTTTNMLKPISDARVLPMLCEKRCLRIDPFINNNSLACLNITAACGIVAIILQEPLNSWHESCNTRSQDYHVSQGCAIAFGVTSGRNTFTSYGANGKPLRLKTAQCGKNFYVCYENGILQNIDMLIAFVTEMNCGQCVVNWSVTCGTTKSMMT